MIKMRLALLAAPLSALLLAAPDVQSQQGDAPPPIQDNSFLVEEAYNQPPGVVQHVSTFEHGRGGAWGLAFTQEWPLFGQRHQVSYTLPLVRPGDGTGAGLGDVQVDYRYQWIGGGAARVSVAPRLGVLLATGDEGAGRGGGRAGAELGLPVSIVLSRTLVGHSNAVITFLADDLVDLEGAAGTGTAVSLAQSVVWLAHPRVNVLLEAAWEREDLGAGSTESLFVSPGVRAALDVAGAQVVPGIAVPIGIGRSSGERMLFLYLSVEHPFR